MNGVVKELLLIKSIDLGHLIDKYHSFFMAAIPCVFVLAILVEYLDRLDPFSLVKRAIISILILSSVTSFYHKSIEASMEAADAILESQKQGNLLLVDMFSGTDYLKGLDDKRGKNKFGQEKGLWDGTLSFLKFHLFDKFVNDIFSFSVFFIVKLCFLILKVVYSLVYYLGYGLIGIPCLIYLFPSMGNVLRGAILSFLWCLIVPHVLVFMISMIGAEINRGYVSGEIIGGSMMGTALLFILSLFMASTPLMTAMILNGSGISQAGGIIGAIGANWVMKLPRSAIHSLPVRLSKNPVARTPLRMAREKLSPQQEKKHSAITQKGGKQNGSVPRDRKLNPQSQKARVGDLNYRHNSANDPLAHRDIHREKGEH